MPGIDIPSAITQPMKVEKWAFMTAYDTPDPALSLSKFVLQSEFQFQYGTVKDRCYERLNLTGEIG